MSVFSDVQNYRAHTERVIEMGTVAKIKEVQIVHTGKEVLTVHTLLTGWIDSIKGYGSTQDVIDSPHCKLFLVNWYLMETYI